MAVFIDWSLLLAYLQTSGVCMNHGCIARQLQIVKQLVEERGALGSC